jgi:hypothetical protein
MLALSLLYMLPCGLTIVHFILTLKALTTIMQALTEHADMAARALCRLFCPFNSAALLKQFSIRYTCMASWLK